MRGLCPAKFWCMEQDGETGVSLFFLILLVSVVAFAKACLPYNFDRKYVLSFSQKENIPMIALLRNWRLAQCSFSVLAEVKNLCGVSVDPR